MNYGKRDYCYFAVYVSVILLVVFCLSLVNRRHQTEMNNFKNACYSVSTIFDVPTIATDFGYFSDKGLECIVYDSTQQKFRPLNPNEQKTIDELKENPSILVDKL